MADYETLWVGILEVPFEVFAVTEDDAKAKVYDDLAFGHLSLAEALVTDIRRFLPESPM